MLGVIVTMLCGIGYNTKNHSIPILYSYPTITLASATTALLSTQTVVNEPPEKEAFASKA